jgi:hypothetical protein
VSVDWHQIAQTYWNEQPHPKDPTGRLKIGEFATAVKLASVLKFGGHANATEASAFWPEFQASGMSPQEFEHAVDRIAPLSFTYHGRPPSIPELVQLKDEHPKNVHSYFAGLPDKHYPHVSAGDMVSSLEAARPHAQEHLGRDPVKLEAAYLHHSRENPADYYSRLKATDETKLAQDNVQTQER